jgi:hypothetical protein
MSGYQFNSLKPKSTAKLQAAAGKTAANATVITDNRSAATIQKKENKIGMPDNLKSGGNVIQLVPNLPVGFARYKNLTCTIISVQRGGYIIRINQGHAVYVPERDVFPLYAPAPLPVVAPAPLPVVAPAPIIPPVVAKDQTEDSVSSSSLSSSSSSSPFSSSSSSPAPLSSSSSSSPAFSSSSSSSSSSRVAEDNDDNWANFEEMPDVVDVGIGEYKINSGGLKTTKLANCVAILAFDSGTGKALLFHYNTTVDDDHLGLKTAFDGDKASTKNIAAVKDFIIRQLNPKGNLQYHIVMGGVWNGSRSLRKMETSLRKALEEIFQTKLGGPNKTATWDSQSKTLTGS